MNSHEAKRVLEMLRPGGADSADPRFAEALKQTKSDPELSQWLAQQSRFDRVVARSLKDVPVPDDLREAILARHKAEAVAEVVVAQPALAPRSFWSPWSSLWAAITLPFNWRGWGGWREWRVSVGAAAAALFIVAALGVWQLAKPVGFSEFRAELVREAWSGETHLDYKSTDMGRIRQWLAGQGVEAEVSLPAALRDLRVQGCQIVEANGQRVPMLCLVEGSKHLHLFVVEGVQLTGLPSQGTPDFERCGSWKTAAWQQGDRTYVLSGLKGHAFVSKFRKAGRWTLGKA